MADMQNLLKQVVEAFSAFQRTLAGRRRFQSAGLAETMTVAQRDIKRLSRQDAELSLLEAVITVLVAQEFLDEKYRDHPLTGNWRGYRDCHLQPDWLLIYRIYEDELQLVRTGTHVELFGK